MFPSSAMHASTAIQRASPGNGTSVSGINITGANNFAPAKKSSGHVYNGNCELVHLGFTDGHVTFHNKTQIQCVYNNTAGPAGWFY